MLLKLRLLGFLGGLVALTAMASAETSDQQGEVPTASQPGNSVTLVCEEHGEERLMASVPQDSPSAAKCPVCQEPYRCCWNCSFTHAFCGTACPAC